MIASLQHALAAHADPDRQGWWERYLKGTAQFRGVTMGQVRREVSRWIDRGDGPVDPHDQATVAVDLLREPLTEDRLAGILLLAEHVRPTGLVRSETLFPLLAQVFDEGHLADWNSVDWLCVKVLAGWLEDEGPPCAATLETWTAAPTLWRRRAAAVSFVPLAPRGDAAFEGLTDALLRICEANVQDPARFSQTSVGWSLRELSRASPERVAGFLEHWGEAMSTEALRSARKHLSSNAPGDGRPRA